MGTKMSKERVLHAATTIFAKLSEGKNDREIADEMGLSAQELVELKARMFDLKAEELRQKPVEHTYVEYMLNQLANVHDLTVMTREFKSTKQYNAMVGAVRARAEIYDKLMTKGQECGLIKKTAERKEIVAGVLVAELSNDDLRKTITAEIAGLARLAKKFGDEDFLGLPEPTALHHGPKYIPPVEVFNEEKPKPKSKKKKKNQNPRSNKSKTNKVSKGRVRMRPSGPKGE